MTQSVRIIPGLLHFLHCSVSSIPFYLDPFSTIRFICCTWGLSACDNGKTIIQLRDGSAIFLEICITAAHSAHSRLTGQILMPTVCLPEVSVTQATVVFLCLRERKKRTDDNATTLNSST